LEDQKFRRVCEDCRSVRVEFVLELRVANEFHGVGGWKLGNDTLKYVDENPQYSTIDHLLEVEAKLTKTTEKSEVS
jgi:hypothetical protein